MDVWQPAISCERSARTWRCSAVAVVKETQSGTTSDSTRATHPNEIGVGIWEVVGKKPKLMA